MQQADNASLSKKPLDSPRDAGGCALIYSGPRPWSSIDIVRHRARCPSHGIPSRLRGSRTSPRDGNASMSPRHDIPRREPVGVAVRSVRYRACPRPRG